MYNSLRVRKVFRDGERNREKWKMAKEMDRETKK